MNLKQLVYKDFNRLTPENLAMFKRKWSKKLGATPRNSSILKVYKYLVEEEKLEKNHEFEHLLTIKKTRSISGVTALAVMTKPFYCPGECIYCPLEEGMPKSYLSDEPASQRAKTHKFDPLAQIKDRLKQLKQTGHKTDKVELIVIGGTFSVYPEKYKRYFFKRMFDACNGITSRNLLKAHKLNETAKQRIVGISIETRPDWVNEREVKLWRQLGVTKVQLGVQAFDENILKEIKRGHSLRPVAEASRLLKNAGFKICYHFMPNLPGSSPEKDVKMAKVMYQDKRFKPDFLKIYPTQVIPGTELYKIWKKGQFQTYNDETLKQILKKIKLMTPKWVRIDRLVRDISKNWVASGTKKSNLRQIIKSELKGEGKTCQCIRCREVKNLAFQGNPELFIEKIDLIGAKEYFLSFEKNNKLYSLLRLRLPNKRQKMLFAELKGAAIIRELHTYGTVVPIDKRQKHKSQHKGLGKALLEKAENLAKMNGFRKIAVISAVGTRGYYKKNGYLLEGYYMTKNLDT